MPTGNAGPKYYLDACVLIDFIERDSANENAQAIAATLESADQGKCAVFTSVLTIAEVVYAKHEIDGRALDRAVEAKIDALWNPASSPIQLVDVHELIVREARRLLRENIGRGWAKTRCMDAIHLATAKHEGVDEFFTSDAAMKKWGQLMGFKVVQPHGALRLRKPD